MDLPIVIFQHIAAFLGIKDKSRFIMSRKDIYTELHPEFDSQIRRFVYRIERCHNWMMSSVDFAVHVCFRRITRRAFARHVFRRLWHRIDALQHLILLCSDDSIVGRSEMTDCATAMLDAPYITLGMLYHVMDGANHEILWVLAKMIEKYINSPL